MASAHRIKNKFRELRARGEAALIPFVVAGDPDLDTTRRLVLELEARGADLIELGVPFSDPMADGPANQRASARGLGAGASFLPLLTMGMSDSAPRDAGLASGIINVSVQLFGAIGLATLGTIATDHTNSLSASGDSLARALTGGYHVAYLVAAVCVSLGVLAAFLMLRPPTVSQPETVSTGQEVEPRAEMELVAA